MSLYLLLLALQADTVVAPPPLKVIPVVPVQQPTTAPPPKVNPTIIYTPAVQTPPPAAAAAAQETTPQQPAAIGLSKASLERVMAERKANAERQVVHKQQLAAVQEAVDKALSAEPFDITALKVALIERDRINTSYREKLTEAVLAMLDAVPAAERLAVAKAVIKGELPTRAAEAPAPIRPSPVGR